MKRIAKLLSVLLLICLLVTSLAACAEPTPPASDPDLDLTNPEPDAGSDPDPEPDVPSKPANSYDLTKYSIIYPNEADLTTSAAASSLVQKLKTKGLMLSTDRDSYLGESNEKPYEILVGDTNRAASSEALKRIETEQGYVIQFFENQIVIQANVSEALEKAVEYFAATYVTEGPSYVVDAKVGDWYACVQRQLAQGGSFGYRLVVGSTAAASVQTAAKNLRSQLQSLTGMSVTLTTDADYHKDTTDIVIGATVYPESKNLREDLQINQYGIAIVDQKIVVNGHHETTILKAITQLGDCLKQNTTVVNGTVMAYVPMNGAYDHSAWLGDIPEMPRGVYDGVYECGENNIQVIYTEADKTVLDDYAKDVCSYGYELKEDHSIGGNRSLTFVGEKGLVHVTYLEYNRSVSIVTDPLTETAYKDSEPAYTKVTENTLAVSTLLYTHREVEDGNGMGYVVTLEDGRYIIFDGGYADQKTGESQADVLFEFLDKNYKRDERTIQIAAWVFSHSHGDHYGAFQSFATKYADRVNIEYFVYNTPSTSMYPGFDSFLAKSLPTTYLPKYFPNTKIIKPHTGQVLKFCNVEFEILYTQENFPPYKLSLLNDSSLMMRMKVNGQTVLFTGDAEASASGLLCKMYGTNLKSDILQINHHGYSGGTVELYDLVDPTYTMWPTSQAAFDLRTTGKKYTWVSAAAVISNKHVYDKVGRSNCFVADGPVEIIHFPLNDKLLDIEYFTHS